MGEKITVVLNPEVLERLAQGEEVRAVLHEAASVALSVAQSGAPDEGDFNTSFSIREGVKGRGPNAYRWVRVWNDSPIANVIEFGAPKRRGPRPRGRYLGRAISAAINKLSGG
jgi:hypothetical protein